MTYCLDTDYLIALLRKDEQAHAFAERLQLEQAELCTTPISLTELFKGSYLSGKETELELIEDLATDLGLLVFDAPAAQLAGRLLAEFKSQGQGIGEADTLIAALALRHNKTLVTRNVKHFQRVPNLKVVEW